MDSLMVCLVMICFAFVSVDSIVQILHRIHNGERAIETASFRSRQKQRIALFLCRRLYYHTPLKNPRHWIEKFWENTRRQVPGLNPLTQREIDALVLMGKPPKGMRAVVIKSHRIAREQQAYELLGHRRPLRI